MQGTTDKEGLYVKKDFGYRVCPVDIIILFYEK